jgi:3-oxoadipate enol-lactonase
VKITIGDIEFGYDRAGSGDPVLLVMGLGTPRIGWFNQFAFLAERYDVTSFDNRGCGETVCSSPWTMQDMASDAIALADAMGYETFHLCGISMGGMISQEIALNFPERIRTLSLLSTSPGGPEAEAMTPEFALALTVPDPKARMRRAMELTFGEKFRRENPDVMTMILDALESGSAGVDPLGGEGSAGFMGQVMAIAAWMGAGGSASRLHEIALPTLVLHGGADLLLPVRNGEIIARDIPGARLRIWPEAGHALNAEYPGEVNPELVSHFESVRVG